MTPEDRKRIEAIRAKATKPQSLFDVEWLLDLVERQEAALGKDEALRVVARMVDESAPPQVLVEYGPGFEEKYLFTRLDWMRTSAGALGYDTSSMRDPNCSAS